MNDMIIQITRKTNEVTFREFREKIREIGLLEKFDIADIVTPVLTFRNEIIDYIIKNGLSSLYNIYFSMEDITTPSMTINNIENIILKFIGELKGAKKIIIIDPYFYAKSAKVDVPKLFMRLLTQISISLKKITFITNGMKADIKNEIHSMIKALNHQIIIQDIITDEFHDRFWIDPDHNKGVVMGTSLNGLGNKISLVDMLSENDVIEIYKLAKKIGA